MGTIPLHLERRCEQRWAARFARQASKPSSEKSEYEKQVNDSACLPKPKEKPAELSRRVELSASVAVEN
jgi:hypothetical protein